MQEQREEQADPQPFWSWWLVHSWVPVPHHPHRTLVLSYMIFFAINQMTYQQNPNVYPRFLTLEAAKWTIWYNFQVWLFQSHKIFKNYLIKFYNFRCFHMLSYHPLVHLTCWISCCKPAFCWAVAWSSYCFIHFEKKKQKQKTHAA